MIESKIAIISANIISSIFEAETALKKIYIKNKIFFD
jgi:hypothetical protein